MHVLYGEGTTLHTSKRMHFIEESHCFCFAKQLTNLHTSKRMHFIEDKTQENKTQEQSPLHTSKRMHFIEEGLQLVDLLLTGPCIRQNVCTSLRSSSSFRHVTGSVTCIRQNVCTSLRIEQVGAELVSVVSLHTSKRMHFIEDYGALLVSEKPDMLAYVKTYALH